MWSKFWNMLSMQLENTIVIVDIKFDLENVEYDVVIGWCGGEGGCRLRLRLAGLAGSNAGPD